MAKFDISKIKSKGRPKGSKDKPYLTLEYWYKEMMKDWHKITPAQRIKLAAQLMQMLTSKMKTMPGTPEQSVLNAKDAHNLLLELTGEKVEEKAIGDSQTFVDPSISIPPVSLDRAIHVQISKELDGGQAC